MSFQVGDKVVCVDDVPPSEGWAGSALSKGTVYCVNAIIAPTACLPPRWSVCLSGTTSTPTTHCYNAARFRKVSEVGHPPIEISINEPVHP